VSLEVEGGVQVGLLSDCIEELTLILASVSWLHMLVRKCQVVNKQCRNVIWGDSILRS
jgi:hypothetical protein